VPSYVTHIYSYIFHSAHPALQIRIDDRGTQHYTQFDAQPHPNVKPMAYASNGMAGMMM
jgi:serine/threonine-protein phosphatase 5